MESGMCPSPGSFEDDREPGPGTAWLRLSPGPPAGHCGQAGTAWARRWWLCAEGISTAINFCRQKLKYLAFIHKQKDTMQSCGPCYFPVSIHTFRQTRQSQAAPDHLKVSDRILPPHDKKQEFLILQGCAWSSSRSSLTWGTWLMRTVTVTATVEKERKKAKIHCWKKPQTINYRNRHRGWG